MIGRTDQQRITQDLVPEFLEMFRRKNKDYSSDDFDTHRLLGTRGQFSDIYRKVGKLKKALWDEQPLVGEQPREILFDLIGHCFLTIAMLDAKTESRSSARARRTGLAPPIEDDEGEDWGDDEFPASRR